MPTVDLVHQFAITNAAYRSGRWHSLAWEGDDDDGWAPPVPANPGAVVHIFRKEPLEKCEWCGVHYCRENRYEHFTTCPSRPEWLSVLAASKAALLGAAQPTEPPKPEPPIDDDMAPDEKWEAKRIWVEAPEIQEGAEVFPWGYGEDINDWEKLMKKYTPLGQP